MHRMCINGAASFFHRPVISFTIKPIYHNTEANSALICGPINPFCFQMALLNGGQIRVPKTRITVLSELMQLQRRECVAAGLMNLQWMDVIILLDSMMPFVWISHTWKPARSRALYGTSNSSTPFGVFFSVGFNARSTLDYVWSAAGH